MKQNILDKINIVKQIKNVIRNHRAVKKSDLTMGMIRVIIVCWLVPYLSLSVVLFYYSETRANGRIKDAVTTSMESAAEICKNNMQSAIDKSKEVSYDGVIKNSYNEYLKTLDESEMKKDVTVYFRDKFKYSSVISSTFLMFNRRTTMEYYTYSNIAGATYSSINDFKKNAMAIVKSEARKLGTGTKFVFVAGHLYLVRNLVTSDYTPFAVLVMEINTANMFASVDNVVWRQEEQIYLDGELLEQTMGDSSEEEDLLTDFAENYVLNDEVVREDSSITGFDRNKMISHLTTSVNGQKLSFIVKLDKVGILNEMSTLIYTYVILVILLIPLIYATFKYVYRNISRPISDLMFASEKIEDGDYGYKIKEFHQNKEFERMIDTFNHMSVSLKESFDRIYAEEVALRDAKMKALQSQINPHFLNNTLEIINWKARMSGNKDVSEMIESLGIMMEATMNRKNESFIPIREEMKYVDAYLCIIVQRFGSKFSFSKEVDESLMDLKVPRLIVQPLVENMVEHGGDEYGNRRGKLKIFANNRYLHIVVENNGNISEKDAKRIDMLLHAEQLEENVHNIGIRNVHRRLKMLYGESSGLSITNPEDDLTVSEIVIERKKLEELG